MADFELKFSCPFCDKTMRPTGSMLLMCQCPDALRELESRARKTPRVREGGRGKKKQNRQ